MPRKFLIDTDTASDDAVALIMALRHPDVDVVAITTVAGNVPVEQCTINALYVAELCESDVPVYMGADKPLTRPYHDATPFHGADGLGDQNYPPPKRKHDTSKHAVQAIIDEVRANPDIVLVTLGPLTNVALAIQQAPDIIENVSRCIVMGGAAATYGNVTPAAEYNIWCDPEAARMVFLSGLSIEMVGWEFCIFEYAILADEMQKIRDFDTVYGNFTIDCNSTAIEAYYEQVAETGISLPDPVAMAVAIDPTIVTEKSAHFVDIECNSELTRGMTVVDKLDVVGDEYNAIVWADVRKRGHKVMVTWEIDSPRWKELLYQLLQ